MNSSMIYPGLFILLLFIVVQTHDFLTGRRLIRDFRDWRMLARRPLSHWDRYCIDNPHKSDIWVCLTTTPSRLPHLEDTLKSLMAQSTAPACIRLHIPEFSKREEKPYVVPEYLKPLQAVSIIRCEDYGPATKLIPALQDADPDQKLLIVDDDKLYPSDFVEHMTTCSNDYPDTAIGSSGWIVPNDLTDRPTTLMTNILQRPPVPLQCTRIKSVREIDILQGYSGYLVRPTFFDFEVITDYTDAPEAAFFVDDVWISAHCRAPKCVVPAKRFCFNIWSPGKRRFFSRTSLGLINRGDGDPATRHNTIMIRYFQERWLTAKEALAFSPSDQE